MPATVLSSPAPRSARSLATSIERGIRDGELAPGALLPTIRALAREVGLSPATVASAYGDLRRRGLISSAGRRGTRVSEQPPLPVTSAPFVPPGARDLATGNPDPMLLPRLESALATFSPEPRAHPDRAKLESLVERARAAFAADGIPTSALAIVAGALEGLERVLALHVVPGDAIAVEDPTFTRILDLLRALGLVATPVAVDDDGPRPDALEHALRSGAKAFVLTPRWQNPFGARLMPGRAAELRDVLDRYEDALVIEDDHAGLIASEPTYSVAAGRPRWASLRSTSKALGADYRLAFLAGDPATVARVEGRQLLSTGWVSHVLQELVLALWSDPATGASVERAASTYAARRDRMLAALAERGIAASGASGLNVWIPVVEETTTVAALLERGWAVAAGERWRLRTGPAIRITTSTLGARETEAVADDLADVLAQRAEVFSS